MKCRIYITLCYSLTLCFIAGAENAQEIVDKVLTGSSTDRDALAPKLLDCPADETISLFLSAYMEGDVKTQNCVLWGLTKLAKSDQLTEAFLACVVSNQETADRAIWLLADRTLSRTLSAIESDAFAEAVRSGKDSQAGTAARAWAKLNPYDPAQATDIITKSFLAQLDDESIGKIPVKGIFVTARAYCLNLFLLAYRDIGELAQPTLKATLDKTNNDDTRMWLTMALAAAGSRDAGTALEPLLRDAEANVSLRVCATGCYATAFGEDARPLLTELLDDQSISDNPFNESIHLAGRGPFLVVAGVARGELSTLDKIIAEKSGTVSP